VDADAERLAWLRLALAPGIGPRTVGRLLERLGGPVEAAAARWRDLRAVAGAARASSLSEALSAAAPEEVLRRAAVLEQDVLTPADDAWPAEAFAGLEDPPTVLFLRGRLPPRERPAVAVVGSREAGPTGRRVAHRLAEDLASAGFWIVSGLATGIDGAAHHGALKAGPRGGGTVAVLGCGLDVSYPVEHVDLKEAIARSGGLVSEHPPGIPPQPGHFPRRNRLVAALSAAVVVVEAGARSGALITAGRALRLGREVLAVPGGITSPTHRGCHFLLKRGEAGLCEDARDVLHALGFEERTDVGGGLQIDPPSAGAPLAIWGVLGDDEVVDADEICRRTGLGAGEVASGLTRLELGGHVARVPGVGVRRL
jgi:DNA processing protein